MARPVALLSDFGARDAYAGVMRAVLLSRCPEVRMVDLTHGIPRGDILAGALNLASAVPYCPPETVFLAVVDPGVGSTRRPLCIRSGSRLFVGPDNGLLWPAAALVGTPEAFHLDRPRYWLPEPGATFHGRDIFAPVAAFLALNRSPEDLGPQVDDPVRLEIPPPTLGPHGGHGEVLMVDGYGNAVTNLRPEHLAHATAGGWVFRVGERSFPGPSTHYAAVPSGEPLVVLGSLGYYEVAVNGGSAAELLGLSRGTAVAVSPRD